MLAQKTGSNLSAFAKTFLQIAATLPLMRKASRQSAATFLQQLKPSLNLREPFYNS
jgi:hypothetical protein